MPSKNWAAPTAILNMNRGANMPLFKKRLPDLYTISWLDCRYNRHELINLGIHSKIVFLIGLQYAAKQGIVQPDSIVEYRQY